ncbi:MAG: M20/M25/M40 family metallo-hydrolase [Candidatus Riflebacteria bacterium]
MHIPIQPERLGATFVQLCEIDSPSRREKKVSEFLIQTFHDLGAAKITEDQSSRQTGADCGNLLISFPGIGNGVNQATILFACHMDTVEPGCGVEVVRNDDIFTSRGNTVLGSDDKSGIAAVIELIRILRETKIDHAPLELLFTTCEEIGLLGAKALDRALLTASSGYALDSTGIDRIIIGAPAANKLKIEVHGIAAHAGLHPEQGISALCLTANAITNLRLGRLDEESTANFGLIHGGVATNIIPDHITIEGEVRSHSLSKLAAHTEEIKRTFQQVIECWPLPPSLEQAASSASSLPPGVEPLPSVEISVHPEYPAMHLKLDDPVITRIHEAGRQLGRKLDFEIAGGGSDANIFNDFGLPTAIIATGMDKVHTTDECLDLNDLIRLTELLYAIAVI